MDDDKLHPKRHQRIATRTSASGVTVEDAARDFEETKRRIQADHAGFYERQERAAVARASGTAPPRLARIRRQPQRLRPPLFVAARDGAHVYPPEARRAGLALLASKEDLILADGTTVAGPALMALLRETPFVSVVWETDNALIREPVEALCVCAREARTPVVVIRDGGEIGGPRPALAVPALYLDIDDDSGSDPVQLFVGPFFDALIRWDPSDVRAALLQSEHLELRPFFDPRAPDAAGWLVDIAKAIPGGTLGSAVLANVLCGESTTLSDIDDIADLLPMPVAFSRERGRLNQGVVLFGRRREE